jgi:bile acid-coenzyme A ligase
MDRFDAEECLRLIEAHQASWICLVPTMMHRIWNLPTATREKYDLSSLKCVWHMAAPCPVWLKTAWIEWLGADRIFEAYAGTEGAGVFITGEEWLRKPGSVGRVAPGTLSVLNSNGESCPAGEIGEIFYPASANKKFHYLGQPLRCDPSGRFSLGDLGHLDEDGYLFLADRRTDLILRGGANVYPAEVESALDAHPAVASSVVLGLASDDLGQRVHAIVQVSPESELGVEELDLFVRSRLSGYKCPETYEFVHLPLRDDAGKVRRSALKAERDMRKTL